MLATAVAFDTVWLVIHYFHVVIFWDAWETVVDYRSYLNGTYRLIDLFAQHNEHRIAFPRLIFLADFIFGRGLNIINVLSTNLIQILHAVLLIRIAASILAGLRLLTISSVICILMLNFGHAENLQWGFQVQFVGVYAAASLAFWWFARSFPPQKDANISWVVASFIMVVVSTYCMSNGFIAGFVLVVLALARRVSSRLLFCTSAFAVANATAYFYHFRYVAQHSPPGYAIAHPLDFLAYVLVYLGAPLGKFSTSAAGVLGAFGTALSAAAAIRLIKVGREPHARTATIGIMIFIILTAAATALGRVFFGISQALEGRYLAPVATFWAAQLVYWASFQFKTFPRMGTAMVTLVGAFPMIGVLRLHEAARENVLWASRKLDAVTDVLLSDVDRPDILRDASPFPEEALQLSHFLFDQHLNVFALPSASWRGLSISSLGIKRDDAACLGEALEMPDGPQRDVLVGWAWDNLERTPVTRIVITNSHDQVVGYGSGGWYWFRPKWKSTPQIHSFEIGWRAYAKNLGIDYNVYAMLENGHISCRLPRVAPPAGPDGTIELPRHIDISNLGAEISVEWTTAGGWKLDGIPPQLDNAPTAIGAVSGSWSNGKGAVGNIAMGLFVAPGAQFAVPYRAGTDNSDLAIEIADAETGQTYARFKPDAAPRWTVLEIDIPRDMAGRNLILKGFSNKSGANAWLALGTPHAIRK